MKDLVELNGSSEFMSLTAGMAVFAWTRKQCGESLVSI
jgi:hypothetical protein